MKTTIETILDGEDLDQAEARGLADQLLTDADDAQIAGILVALRAKGVTAAELAGFAEGLRANCRSIESTVEPLVDTCGTGGDAHHTFNVSTTSALLAAAMGVAVAKHGNRAVSSASGSSDVLESLGVPIDASIETSRRMLVEVGFGYFHAPTFHPAMGAVASARQSLGIRTVFNLIGPLTNPADASRQVIGVFDAETVDLVAGAVARLGTEHALIVHGAGIDEIAVHAPTVVAEVKGDEIERYELTPTELGLDQTPIDAIAGGTPQENAAITRRILTGAETSAKRDIVMANAGAAAYVGGRTSSIGEGVELAQQTLEDGGGARLLDRLTQEVAS